MSYIIIRFFLLMLFLNNWVLAQYLFNENFEDISDWTVYSTGSNHWLNDFGNDSLFGVEGKSIFVSCTTCDQKPLYFIDLTSNLTRISTNSAITIPTNNYKIKFSYFNLARVSDILSIEYSYDNSTWNNLSNLPMSTKWNTISFPVTDLSGFTPGSSVYFRFVLDVGTTLIPHNRMSCGIDNFVIVSNDWDITNLSTTLFIGDNSVLYLKNADYESNNSAVLESSGSFILDNGSSFKHLGTYTSGTDSLIFKGDKPQHIVAPVQPVGTVYIDKPNAYLTVLSDSFLEIKDRLHFVKGILKSSAKRFPINLTTSNNPIASDSGFVDGAVKYYANITDRLFPTGHKGFYRPIVLDNGSLHYTIRYWRENSTATYIDYFLDSVSTQGYWAVDVENTGMPSPTQKTKIHFKTGDYVYDPESTRVAISEYLSGPYVTNEQLTNTFSGTPSNGTVEVNGAFVKDKYFIRLGFAKDGRINLKAMLQGALMESTKVLWEDKDFLVSNWTVAGSPGMNFVPEAGPDEVHINRPWRDAFNTGLAFVNSVTNTNRWANLGLGSANVHMNSNVPISFSASEIYYLEFDYLYDGNSSNQLYLRYSVDNGSTWNNILLTPTMQKWELMKIEINNTNFPGFIKGTTPIRFGFRGVWGSPNITDANVPSPLIDNIRVTQKTAQPEEMTYYMSSSYMLDSLVEQGVIPTYFKVPYGAVDIIEVELRNNNTSSYTVMDKQLVWLMRDGSIKNLSGLNYVKFVNQNSGSYYFVIKHRNHLPVMTPTPVTFNPTTESTIIDFTDIANIMDATAYQYRSGPAKYALYLGNATEDFLNFDYYETNATDFFVVSTKVDQLPDRNYHREDLNLDGFVNADDFDLVQLGNDNLYFTTVPEP